MRKRFLAKILMGTLICSLLTGCGGKAGTADSGRENDGEITSGSFAEQSADKEQASDVSGKSEETKAGDGDASRDAHETARKFAKDLLGECLEGENPVLSPVSAYIALTLAGEGAKGETAEEFVKIFGEDSAQVCEDLMKRLPADGERIKVKLANSAWLDERMTPDEAWMAKAKNSFLSEVFQTKLSTAKTKNKINDWVEQNTAGLIRQFLTEPLDDDARLVLFNTVYFKGKWVHPFEAVDTYERPFTLDDQKTVVNVPTMNLYKESLSYIKSEDCEGIVLPYRDTDLVFVALKPTDASLDIRGLYDKLDVEEIGRLVDSAAVTKVNLHLPKFEVSFDRKLNDDLIHMGLVRAFDKDLADFSGLGTTQSGEPLYISLVRQKAVFILDEEGTEAAAVTQVAMFEAGMAIDEEPPIEVDFNEPFLYMVYDKESGLWLFAGIMDNPA